MIIHIERETSGKMNVEKLLEDNSGGEKEERINSFFGIRAARRR